MLCAVSQSYLPDELLHTQRHTPLPVDCPVDIPEGIYLIQNAFDGRAIQSGPERNHVSTRVFMAPSRHGSEPAQLWAVLRLQADHCQYMIRCTATGSALDVNRGRSEPGTAVLSHPYNAEKWQAWTAYRSREGET